MIETLFVNGCSWTEGFLLHEEQHVRDYAHSLGYEFTKDLCGVTKNGEPKNFPLFEVFNKFNWAGIVAEQLSIPNTVNYATGAGSNRRIVRTTIDYVKNMSTKDKMTTMIIIGWSSPDRSEIYLDDKLGYRGWEKFNVVHSFDFTALRPGLDEKFIDQAQTFWEHYTVNIHNDYACIFEFFQQSYLLANLLENMGIKYYFFNSFPVEWNRYQPNSLMTEFKHDTEIYHSYNVHDVNDDFFFFLDKHKDKGVHLSDGHPNCLGYKLWANHILDSMQEKGLIL